MSDNKPSAAVVKVKYFRKRNKQLEKVEFNYKEQLKIRKWFLTGTFSDTFFLKDDFDKSFIGLVKKVIQHDPIIISNLMEETLEKSLNKKTFIYTLVLLSNDNFKAKKIFKTLFNRVISNPKDLYYFMECCKKERGFGQIIHEAIKGWLKHLDIHKLEQMFVEHRHGYNWKSQDVLRLIKPKPTTHKEQLLYQWIAKDEATEEYKEVLPLIYYYERMRNNKEFNPEIIKALNFKNSMIPSNVERTKKIISNWLTNFEEIDYPLTSMPKYLDKMNSESMNSLCLFMKSPGSLKRFSLLTILSAYSMMLEESKEPESMGILYGLEEALEDRIKRTHNTCIHLLDTNVTMLDKTMKDISTSPAILSSVMIGYSKNVIDFNGNVIGKRSAREIIEAEGFNKNKYLDPNYKRIFYEMEKMESDLLTIWTNNKSFDKERFMREFTNWKTEKQKMIKIVFINLYEPKTIAKLNKYKEIYGINEKTEKLIEFIKKGEL